MKELPVVACDPLLDPWPAGYEWVSPVTQEELLERADARPDLVITDVMMPYVTGYDLLERMYGLPGYEAVPSVLMSAIDSRNHPSGGKWNALIQKPFSLDTLVGAVETLIGKPQ